MTREDDEQPVAFSVGPQADAGTILTLAPSEHSLSANGGAASPGWGCTGFAVAQEGIFGVSGSPR